MQIEKIESFSKNNKYATITLSKQELLDMTNLMFEGLYPNYPELNKRLTNSVTERSCYLYYQFTVLRDLIEYGVLTDMVFTNYNKFLKVKEQNKNLKEDIK